MLAEGEAGENFNSRPSARGDRLESSTRHVAVISIHAPPRGATTASRTAAKAGLFQFTPLREGRRWLQAALRMRCNISIHAPPRGATARADALVDVVEFQFTPLREGRLGTFTGTSCRMDFNSRPSARGDSLKSAGTAQYLISIHAPPRGATTAGMLSWTRRNFNSRPSARGDGFGVCDGKGVGISIHAPPRGATIRLPRG